MPRLPDILPYFGYVKHVSATLGAFAKFMKVTNYTGYQVCFIVIY